MRYWVQAMLAVAVVVTSESPIQGQSPPSTRISVGAWNIEWLGMPENRSGGGQDVAQKADDLAGYIEDSRVDVLALEEICDTDEEEGKNSNFILGRTVLKLNSKPEAKWRYKLFPKRDPQDTEQLTAVIWNTKRATVVGEPFKIPLNPDDEEFFLWKRHPYAVKFSVAEGKSDFVVIPVHMKSNRDGDGAGKKQRGVEAQRLVQVLDQVRQHFNDKDLLILGDFNFKSGDEWAGHVLTEAGFLDLNAADENTYLFGNQVPFDRIMVTKGQPEFEDLSFWIMRPESMDEAGFRRRLSDHYMVKTSIKVRADDD